MEYLFIISMAGLGALIGYNLSMAGIEKSWTRFATAMFFAYIWWLIYTNL